MKISILKTHLAGGEWVHAGTTADVDESRAKELIRNGLAAEVADEKKPALPASGTRAARTPSNKKAVDPDNKAESGNDSPAVPDSVPAAGVADTAPAATESGPSPAAAE